MKKAFVIILILGIFLMAGIAAASPNINSMADSVAYGSGYTTAGVDDTTLSKTIGGLIRVILSMVGIIFLALTVYAGILWMTAGGNDDRIEKAQKIFIRSTVGLILVISSYSIAYFALKYTLATDEPNYAGSIAPKSKATEFSKGFTNQK